MNTLFGLASCNILKPVFVKDIFNQEENISQKDIRGSNVDAYISNGCRRGFRHFKKLPVGGQRNKTNAKTRKKFKIY